MKKIVSIVLALMLALCCLQAIAEESIVVYVTIANADLELVYEAIDVVDADGDGALTVNDALILAHETAFEGGAEAGYGYDTGDYGLYITKLWGVENGGGYGYYLNNTSCWSLSDSVSDGDMLNAFVYTDLANWSDTYSYFDTAIIFANAGQEIALTLYAAGWDENYAPIAVPVSGAVITINGEATEYVTDENGAVVISVPAEVINIISAESESMVLVPPCCVAICIAE